MLRRVAVRISRTDGGVNTFILMNAFLNSYGIVLFSQGDSSLSDKN